MIHTSSQRYIDVPNIDVSKFNKRFALAILGMVAIYASYIILYDNVWLSITSILIFIVQLTAIGGLRDCIYLADTPLKVEDLPVYVEEQIQIYRKFGRAAVVMIFIDFFPLYLIILNIYVPWSKYVTTEEAIIFSIIPNISIMLINLYSCGCTTRELLGWKETKLETIYNNFLATGMTEEELEEEKVRNEERINCERYGVCYRKIDDSFIYNDVTRKVFINGREYDYAQVVGYTIEDNSYRRMSVTSKETTDPLNFLGRAAVGDALYGRTGAMMGGMTANRNVESEVYEHVTPCHTIFITVDSMFTHTEQLMIYNDTPKVREIESVLRVVTLRR